MGRIHHALYVRCRELGVSRSESAWAGRAGSPTAAIIDSQSMRGPKRGRTVDPSGWDAGKSGEALLRPVVRGKKRRILVDTQGLLMHAVVHTADVQDRDGGVLVMATLFGLHPVLLRLYADSGYAGPKLQDGLRRACRQVDVEIVRRSDTGKFVMLPRRWIVERTHGAHGAMPG